MSSFGANNSVALTLEILWWKNGSGALSGLMLDLGLLKIILEDIFSNF